MSHLHCSRKKKSGQHLGWEDRKILEYLYNQNLKRGQKERFTQKELADQLGWSEATLSRELKRGMVNQQASDLTTYQAYSSYVAQCNVEKNWETKGPPLKIGKDHQLAQTIEEMLLGKEMVSIGKLRYSPTAIVMYFEKKAGQQPPDFVLVPSIIMLRLRKLNSLERRLGTRTFREKFKTITVDNGAEFADWKKLETSLFRKEKRTEIYHARAYASWERGSTENLNGFIRYFIPKGSRLKDIPVKEIKQFEDFINRYPRKILGGSSAENFAQAAA